MFRAFWILAVIVALSTSAWAGDEEAYQDCLKMQRQGYAIGCMPPSEQAVKTEDKKKPITYEVKIAVTYNAASEYEAAEIARKALARHGGACKFNVTIKKTGDITGTGDVEWTHSALTFPDSATLTTR